MQADDEDDEDDEWETGPTVRRATEEELKNPTVPKNLQADDEDDDDEDDEWETGSVVCPASFHLCPQTAPPTFR